MNLILNRNFELPEDGWYQLAPAGEYPVATPGQTGPKLVQVLDDMAFAAMANRFGQLAQVPNFTGMLVDFDHFSLDGEKRSEASARPGGRGRGRGVRR